MDIRWRVEKDAPPRFWTVLNNLFSAEDGVRLGAEEEALVLEGGNVAADPLFDPLHPFRLLPASPCIDAGNKEEGLNWAQLVRTVDPQAFYPANPLTCDYEANPRAIDGDRDGTPWPDIGAFEFIPASPQKPDFTIASLSTDPSPLARGGPFTARVVVRNQGPGWGLAGRLRLWLHHPGMSAPREASDAFQEVGFLDSGQSRALLFTGLTATNRFGTFTLRAFIDGDNAVAETSEGNNQKTLTYEFIRPYVEKPDFVVQSIETIPAVLTPGCVFTARVLVRNSGKASGSVGLVRLWLHHPAGAVAGEEGVAQRKAGDLTPGASLTLMFPNLVATNGPGAFTLRAFADAKNATIETSEGNNQKTLAYSFPPSYREKPDLVVESMTTTPAILTPGCVFQVTVCVKNNGLGTGEAGALRVWVNHLGNANPGEPGDASQILGLLKPGARVEHVFTGLMAPAGSGTHTLRAYADADNVTLESSEGNNQANRTYEYR